MTSTLTISVPDDVAEAVNRLPKGRRSAFCVEALRRALERAETDAWLAGIAEEGPPGPSLPEGAANEALAEVRSQHPGPYAEPSA